MDITNFIINQAKETLTEAEPAEDVNPNKKVPASPEGMAIAYVSLLIMAIFPIFFGSFRSVKHHESKKVNLVNFFSPASVGLKIITGLTD